MANVSDFFAPGSPLGDHLPAFQPRPGQAAMAEVVADALEHRGRLVVEAGTGTGKTFAYLVPALLSGRKTIVSTGTRALQDQLYHRDLPLVGRAIGRPVTTALLKGRSNYLCLHRLEAVAGQSMERALSAELRTIREWRHRTSSGDKAEVAEVAEDSAVWPQVTSTAENCLGRPCPHWQACHVVRARRAAQEADFVVVNHHLLLADLALKEAGFLEFLPGADAVILDEAHQLPDLAARFFGVSIGSRELERLLGEVRLAALAGHRAALEDPLNSAQRTLLELLAAAPRAEGRHELAQVQEALTAPLAAVRAAFAELADALGAIPEPSAATVKLLEQANRAQERLATLAADDAWDGLRWLEVNPRSIRLHLTPLDVSQTLGSMIAASPQAWVFTSATLAVGDEFSHFTGRLGIGDADCLGFPSPYALERRALVYLPPGLPAPNDPRHTAAVLAAAAPLLESTAGGMFCLFTSLRALAAARDWWEGEPGRLRGRPLLVQGEAPRDDLLRRFRALGNAVLLGSATFWEGVDVRGRALTIVCIDKLPFASPADPLTMARSQFIRRQGGNPFTEHQLPQAALSLKQGAGRLLRDASDFGVVVLCDRRVTEKAYGSTFLAALAPMPATESLADVRQFLVRHEQGSVAVREKAG